MANIEVNEEMFMWVEKLVRSANSMNPTRHRLFILILCHLHNAWLLRKGKLGPRTGREAATLRDDIVRRPFLNRLKRRPGTTPLKPRAKAKLDKGDDEQKGEEKGAN